MSDFLPAGYETPSTGGLFTKLEQGHTKVRILTRPILGWELWEDDEVTRVPFIQGEPKPGPKYRHFWLIGIYNYASECMQVWTITQSTIIDAIKALAENKKWGDPFTYDLDITREGEKLKTKYTVTPDPKEEVSEEVKEAYAGVTLNLGGIFNDEDTITVNEDAPESKAKKKPAAKKKTKKEVLAEVEEELEERELAPSSGEEADDLPF